jgi:transposase
MSKKKRWSRNEKMYNKIQETEFLNFFNFVRFISLKVCKGKKMRNVIVCLIVWHKFPNLSARRARGLLVLFKRIKLINVQIPCFKSLCNYRAESLLGNVLDELIEESSKPLAKIEHDFATDATGIKTKLFSTWYSLRCKKKIRKKDHLNIHISSGVKSNTVTALNVEIKKGKDNAIMRDHVDKTNINFDINEWSGDGMYWCKENCKKVVEVGAKPYFKVHKNWSGKSRGGFDWKQMNLEFEKDKKAYEKHYHKRSNVESTNMSKKMLHGNKVYSRLDSARINEETLRWINHNLNVLNRAKHQWNITPKFME